MTLPTSFYQRQILPRIVHFFTAGKALGRERSKTLSGAKGVTLEIGFGSGQSLPYYPPAVTRLLAVEPSETARELATPLIARAAFPVEFSGLDGEALPIADASVDTAVTMLTLCTVPHPEVACRELFRVLKPGGRLLFLEHGAAKTSWLLKLQKKLNPLEAKIFGGCQLDRDMDKLIRSAGFEMEILENYFVKSLPPTHGYLYRGIARKP